MGATQKSHSWPRAQPPRRTTPAPCCARGFDSLPWPAGYCLARPDVIGKRVDVARPTCHAIRPPPPRAGAPGQAPAPVQRAPVEAGALRETRHARRCPRCPSESAKRPKTRSTLQCSFTLPPAASTSSSRTRSPSTPSVRCGRVSLAELFTGRVGENGRLLDWYDGVVLAVFPGPPPKLVGLLAWFPEIRLKVYAVMDFAPADLHRLMSLSTAEPYTAEDLEAIERLTRRVVAASQQEPTIVVVSQDAEGVMREFPGRREDVVRSLPFGIESALRPRQVELWRAHAESVLPKP